MLRPLLALGLALGIAAVTQVAAAADNKWAVVTVNNFTPDLTFTFDVRWGKGKWETVKPVPPGRATTFSHPLDANGRAPGFQVRLNRAIGNAKPVIKTWDLTWKASPNNAAKSGTHYEIFRDLIDRQYVWLAEVGRR